MLGNQPPASFGLIARQFLYVMSRIQSPLCTYCRRWPCSDHLDSCRLCRCCFQISQFGRDQSLTEQRYLDLVARLTVILGELAAHSSWPWELGRSTESQSRPQHHRRVRSSSRSSSDRSPLRRRIGCQIEKEERHKENREARSSPTPKPRSSRGQETWTPTLRHRRTPSPNFPIFSAQPALELRPAPRPPPKQEGVQAASHYNTPPPPPPPSEGGGSESESESESDDEEQLALEEEVVREKKEAHARYMRFHRSLSSFLDLISIHSVSCVVKNHHALRSKGSRGSQTKPGSNHDVEGIINDNVLGVFVRACMTISNVNFTRCMLHMMCAYSKEIGAHTLSCGLV